MAYYHVTYEIADFVVIRKTNFLPPGLVGGVIHDRISSVENVPEENKQHTKVCLTSPLRKKKKGGGKDF